MKFKIVKTTRGYYSFVKLRWWSKWKWIVKYKDDEFGLFDEFYDSMDDYNEALYLIKDYCKTKRRKEKIIEIFVINEEILQKYFKI